MSQHLRQAHFLSCLSILRFLLERVFYGRQTIYVFLQQQNTTEVYVGQSISFEIRRNETLHATDLALKLQFFDSRHGIVRGKLVGKNFLVHAL